MAGACFAIMGCVCATWVHTQEPCPSEKSLQILFTAFAPEGNCRKIPPIAFFFLISSLVFDF
jgi:hypothetical protein